jgi:hypothetical protein
MKESVVFILLGLIILGTFGVYAQDNVVFDDIDDSGEDIEGQTSDVSDNIFIREIYKEYGDIELDVDAGVTPDDGIIYSVDKFLDQIFINGVDRMKERMAEVRVMIQDGNVEGARIALILLKKEAENLEEDISPEQRAKIRKTVAQIKNVLEEIRGDIPNEYQEEFVNNVLDKQKNLATAVEIREKIKTLCEELANLNPEEFHRICQPNEYSSRWEQRFFEDLSAEQRYEANKFVKVISSCFEDPSNCDCESSTNIQSFVDKCKIISQAEKKCRLEDDSSACVIAEEAGEDIMDSLENAPHLQEALEEIERKFSVAGDERFEHDIPRECIEAGITGRKRGDRQQCMRITIEHRDDIPDECMFALKEALDRGVTSEREFRKICEPEMFKQNAPKECVIAGLTDHKSCGKFIFQQNAPPECIDAGLTGESPRDGRRCQELMEKTDSDREFDEKYRVSVSRGRKSPDCRNVQDSEKRLACYDSALREFEEGDMEDFGGYRDFDERYSEIKGKERYCAENSNGRRWDFSGGTCTYSDEERREDFNEGKGNWQPSQEFDSLPKEYVAPEKSVSTESSSSDTPSETVSSDEESLEKSFLASKIRITGAVITGNAFVDYYFGYR